MTHEPIVRDAVFEALFVRALQPTGRFHDGLAAAGFDLRARKPEYPCSVLGRCLEVAAAEVLPGRPPAQAFRELGRIFVTGILSTLLGKAIGPALLVAGPARVMKRIPSLVKSDLGIDLQVVSASPGNYRVSAALNTPAWAAELLAGMMDGMLSRADAKPRVTVSPAVDSSSPFVIDVEIAPS